MIKTMVMMGMDVVLVASLNLALFITHDNARFEI